MTALHFAEGAGEQKKLLEHESAPRKLKILKACGKVNVLIGIVCLRKMIFFAQAIRQRLGQLGRTRIQCLTHSAHDELLRKPGRQLIQGNDAPRYAADRALALNHGIRHCSFAADSYYLAVDVQAVASVYAVFDIRLIEKCYVNRTAFIHHAELHKLQTPADTHEVRILGGKGIYADSLAVAGQADGLKAAAILIFPRKIRNKVTDVKDAELIEKQRLFFAYAFAVSYIGFKIVHF